MTVSIRERFRSPPIDTLLNVLILLVLIADLFAGLAVYDQRAENEDAQVLTQAPPSTTAPSRNTTAALTEDATSSRVTLEELQTSIAAAQVLTLQNQGPVSAADLGSAVPSLNFVAIDRAGQGLVGVDSSAAGTLLLTQDAAGTWVCASFAAFGETTLGGSDVRGAVDGLDGCEANAR